LGGGVVKGVAHTMCRQIVEYAVDRRATPEFLCPPFPRQRSHPHGMHKRTEFYFGRLTVTATVLAPCTGSVKGPLTASEIPLFPAVTSQRKGPVPRSRAATHHVFSPVTDQSALTSTSSRAPYQPVTLTQYPSPVCHWTCV